MSRLKKVNEVTSACSFWVDRTKDQNVFSYSPNVTQLNLYEEKLYNRCHDSELETLFEKLEKKKGRNQVKTKMRQVCAEDNNSRCESQSLKPSPTHLVLYCV